MNIEFPDDLNRASNIILLTIILILSYKYNLSILYTIKLYFGNAFINYCLKYYLFKPIMKGGTYPIIGRGLRPEGAKNCGEFRDNFFDTTITPKLSTSYGFPSGHSQCAGLFMTFIYEHFRDKPYIFYSSLIYSLYIPYTRVKLGCHTIEQIIFGYIFGIITYYLFEYIHKSIYVTRDNIDN
jgi:membrane-associated phospholipid phosphatase